MKQMINQKIKKIETNLESFLTATKEIRNRYSRPNHFSANWVAYGALFVSTFFLVRYFENQQNQILNSVYEAKVTSKNLFLNYVYLPLTDVYRTIRYDDHLYSFMEEKGLKIIFLVLFFIFFFSFLFWFLNLGIRSSEDSLGSMVEIFIQKKDPTLRVEKLKEIRELTKTGDLSTIMPYYEKQMMRPIKNSVFGDMVTLLLIQVQKQKLDVEKAMFTLDKLMKSNELNFQMMAILPLFLIIYASFSSLYSALNSSPPKSDFDVRIKNSLMKIEKLLIMENVTDKVSSGIYNNLSVFGEIVVKFAEIQSNKYEDFDSSTYSIIVEDICDIVDSSFEIKQKLGLVKRLQKIFSQRKK
jgi:hypothetical protein